MIQLKQYQEKAVENLLEKTEKLLENPRKQKHLVLKATTGAGKTVILADYIEKAASSIQDEVCFLWLSIGKGNLHEQSKRSLTNILQGHPPVYMLDEVINNGIIQAGEVVMVNWESLNSKTKGEWTNVFMRDGEKTNFQELVDATNESRKIILIIDESHHTANSKTSQEIMDIINPEITVEVSATPTHTVTAKEERENIGYDVEVNHKEVIQEGMVKKEVWINDNLDDVAWQNKSYLQLVLDMALKRREELAEDYRSLGKTINPLCLVQIPNARQGDEVLAEVEEHLKAHDITVENGRLAIWTTKRDENRTGITQLDSPVDVLIFKVAIATGWDSPRSQVLVKLRETKSETLDIQTIGRILRMPEQCHYENERLNRAYVYTNIASVDTQLKKLSIVKFLQGKKRENLPTIQLQSQKIMEDKALTVDKKAYQKIWDETWKDSFGVIKGAVEENKELLEAKGFSFTTDGLTQKLFTGSVLYEELGENEEKELKTFKEMEMSHFDIDRAFDLLVEEGLPKYGQAILKPLIFKFYVDYLGFRQIPVRDMVKLTMKNHVPFFQPIFISVWNQYKQVVEEAREYRVLRYEKDFQLPERTMEDSETYEPVDCQLSYHSPVLLQKDRSKPERDFESYLESQPDKVYWWYKNGDSGEEHFSIRYEYGSKAHLFYPDFIVCFHTGKIGLFETKGIDDRDAATFTKAKAEALQEYVKDKSEVVGGIVRTEKGVPFINTSENYQADNQKDWKPML